MSQADIDTLRAGYEAISRGDWDSLMAGAAPNFELKTASRVTNPGTYTGVPAVRRFFEDLFEPFEQIVAEPQRFFDRGEQIAVLLLVRFRPRGSTAVVENRIGHLWTFRDGKAVRLEIFPEREKVLEAIGMSATVARVEAA